MPPGPQKTPLADANLIAAYMHDAFYSPVAQDRNRPARVELQRLTVKQTRHAIADLVNGETPESVYKQIGGLKGRYWTGRMWNGNPLLERKDGSITFNFGTDGPPIAGEKKFDPYNFAMFWDGSLIAPDTGEYEFIVKSDHAVRLTFNHSEKPLVDGWVKSGTETEFRGTTYLQGGHAYPIRFEFSKAGYGVEEQDKRKQKPSTPAFVRLEWRRPKMSSELIPARFFSESWSPAAHTVDNPFPPDDRSIGYERGVTVNKAWDDAATVAAISAADYVVAHAKDKLGVELSDPHARTKAIEYCTWFTTRAFRRYLTEAQKAVYVDRQFSENTPIDEAIRRSILLTLKSPRFLYRQVEAADAFGKAEHLAFGLWDTIPDTQLLQAAGRGELDSPEGVRRHAERMANSPRATHKLKEFLLAWLKVDDRPDIVKSPKQFPDFDDQKASDLQHSLELFLDDSALKADSTYTGMFTHREYPINGRLAPLYNVGVGKTSDFKPVMLDNGTRAGVLMHPYVMARFAYLDTSSPIHRGVLIARSMLGRVLQPPPAAFAPVAASLHPTLTTRERVAMQTKPTACNNCHAMINPLGFALERFDALGRVRTSENGKKVDTSGYYRTRSGDLVRFTGAGDLSRFLATSEEAQSAFAEKLFHHVVRQPALAYRPTMVPDLHQEFAKKEFRLRDLLTEIVVQTIPTTMPAEKLVPQGETKP
jgi:hypothetical protein